MRLQIVKSETVVRRSHEPHWISFAEQQKFRDHAKFATRNMRDELNTALSELEFTKRKNNRLQERLVKAIGGEGRPKKRIKDLEREQTRLRKLLKEHGIDFK